MPLAFRISANSGQRPRRILTETCIAGGKYRLSSETISPIRIIMQASKPSALADRAPPGRPREFDIDEAVENAIRVFRAHGYHGTSVQDLTEGTGLARGSLYKAFHDKRTLFLAALDHYTAASLRRIADALAQPGSAREAIREALLGYARRAAVAQGQQGCLITAATMEMTPGDIEVGAIIARMFRRMQDLFAAAVIRGQSSGEISGDLDERAAARMLVCVIQGLRVLGKTGPSEQDMIEVAETALRALS
jgi:TetR/AcrR family transcriptional repressor of nem operon